MNRCHYAVILSCLTGLSCYIIVSIRVENANVPYLRYNGPIQSTWRLLPEWATTPSLRTTTDIEGHKIPRIIHQNWKNDILPDAITEWVKSCRKLHPGWEYWFWTDTSGRELIRNKFPWFLGKYDSYPLGVNRADAIRYFILYQYGGVYLDIDMECLQPLDPILELSSCFVSDAHPLHYVLYDQSDMVDIATFGCQPKHPLFHNVFKILQSRHKHTLLNSSDLLSNTGPFLFFDAMREYTNDDGSANIEHPGITRIPYKILHPTYDNRSNFKAIKSICATRNKSKGLEEACLNTDRNPNIPFPESLTVHHWIHTYYGFNVSKQNRISEVVKPGKVFNPMTLF